MAAPTEPSAARRSAQPVGLLALPITCLEKVLQLALFDDEDDSRLLQASFGDPDDGAAVVFG